jgi:carbon starvation protein
MHDGVDYCPAKAPVLFGHHFASIAGAAPIIGPVVAVAFGWLPVLLWIVIGGIFLGSVHDFSALMASLRHQGRSIGEVIGVNVNHLCRQLFLIFLWATLVLVIAVFIVVVSKTFVAEPSAGTSSSLFIFLAVIFGLTIYRWKAPLWLATLVGLLFLILCMYVGWYYPLSLPYKTWNVLLFVYIFIASVTPVWILLQPRDYLNSFLFYAVLIAMVVGVFVANPSINAPAFTSWYVPELGYLFPILFVTVACGAISGFHSVVASGTTAKQLDNEKDAKKIAFGGMLVESLVAVLATIMAIMFINSDYMVMLKDQGPVYIFASGVGKVMSAMGFSEVKSVSFATLAVSAFVLTSLDTATRLARFAFQEFFAPRAGESPSILFRNRFIGTAITVAAAIALTFSGKWPAIWPVFGAANQLLAALALLAVTVWLTKGGLKPKFTAIPMFIMFAITISALVSLVVHNYSTGDTGLLIVGLILFGVAVVVIYEALITILKTRKNNR